jgi:LytS/YehU family sensor histidine kinase
MYALLVGWEELISPPEPRFMFFCIRAFSASCFFAAFLWLSPLPWQLNGKLGLPDPKHQAPLAFLIAEAIAMVLVLLDDLMSQWAGQAPHRGAIYLTNFCFQGVALFFVGLMLANQEHLERERLESRERAEAARAELLMGQLRPHTLFNALNGLAELMRENPPAANRFLESMSGLLLRTIQATGREHWTLGEEQELVMDSLHMQELRLEDRLEVSWRWNDALNDRVLPPLTLYTLVENALKHGVLRSEGGGKIQVIAQEGDKKALHLEVRNTGPTPKDCGSSGTGLGLSNLASRLALAHGPGARVQLDREGDWTRAWIEIPAGAGQAPRVSEGL